MVLPSSEALTALKYARFCSAISSRRNSEYQRILSATCCPLDVREASSRFVRCLRIQLVDATLAAV